jgi:hypothetical protein
MVSLEGTRVQCSGGGDLTVAVEVNMHHGCRGRVARLAVELPPPEEVRLSEAGVEDEIL